MKFNKVVISNFRRFGEGVEIPLDVPGLTLISGKNKDAQHASSNGASKSSVLYSVCWCLFGKCPDGQAADDVINSDVGKNCKVELHIEDGNNSIVVCRTRKYEGQAKENDLVVTLNNVDVSGSTNEMTQEKLLKLIGMDMAIFCALQPGLGVEISTLTDAEIKALFEKIMRTEELAQAHALAKEEFKDATRLLEQEAAEFQRIKGAVAEAKIRLQTYTSNESSFEVKKQNELAKLQKEKAAAKEATLLSVEKYKEAKAHSSKKVAAKSSDKLLKELAELTSEVGVRRKALDNAKKNLTAAETKFSVEKKALEIQAVRLKGLGKQCPTCQQGVSDLHCSGILDGISKSLDSLKDSFEKEVLYLQGEVKGAKEDLDFALANEKRVSDLVRDQEKVEATIEAKKAAEAKELKLLKIAAEEKAAYFQQLVDSYKEAKASKNMFTELVSQEAKSVKELDAKVTLSIAKQKELAQQVELLKFWVDSFSPTGLRSYMMENLIPYLNSRATYYCNAIFGTDLKIAFHTKTTQKSGKVVEKFNIEVAINNGSPSLKGTSAGERARINLVLALVLGDLAALQASKKLDFMAIDEILDAIDASGDEAIVELLKSLETKISTIYLITHKDSLKNKIPKEMVIQKKDGFATFLGVFEKDVIL